ncbi:nuclear transport factor 2 family protein [Pseudomonas sp.]|uniref:YybH family protein n=1 Tax=Pseudomonas sp. TaxID=306 RepID=UPI002355113B|nr:nuclear transport factor 2 family protein [Pseudomonas sp.]
MPKKPIFTSPQEAETAFYEALERGDLDAMMAVWSEDEEIVCVHPGGPRLTGYATVREAWRRIFEGGSRLKVQLLALSTVHGPFAAVHSVVEQIGVVGDKQLAAPVAATNVYVRGALGWRMIVHHASPVPPSSIGDAPQVLH